MWWGWRMGAGGMVKVNVSKVRICTAKTCTYPCTSFWDTWAKRGAPAYFNSVSCLQEEEKKKRRKKVSLCSPLIINAWRASRTWFWVQWVRSVVHTPRIHRIFPYIRTLQITSAIYHHSDINLSSSSDIWEKRKWWRWTKITPSSYMFGYTPLWNTAGYWQPRSNAAVTVASR